MGLGSTKAGIDDFCFWEILLQSFPKLDARAACKNNTSFFPFLILVSFNNAIYFSLESIGFLGNCWEVYQLAQGQNNKKCKRFD